MANAIVMRVVDVTAVYAALGTHPNDVSVDISCPPTNTGIVYFEGDDLGDVPWQPGEWHTLTGIDLSAMRIRGTVGDKVTIVGGEW